MRQGSTFGLERAQHLNAFLFSKSTSQKDVVCRKSTGCTAIGVTKTCLFHRLFPTFNHKLNRWPGIEPANRAPPTISFSSLRCKPPCFPQHIVGARNKFVCLCEGSVSVSRSKHFHLTSLRHWMTFVMRCKCLLQQRLGLPAQPCLPRNNSLRSEWSSTTRQIR